jgi:hypothetical protein
LAVFAKMSAGSAQKFVRPVGWVSGLPLTQHFARVVVTPSEWIAARSASKG